MLWRIFGFSGCARKLRALVAAVPLFSLIFAAPALADKRVALVIGNSAYQNVNRLPNPKNDAALMAKTLAGLGFTLIGGGAQVNLDKAALDKAVQRFGRQIEGAKVALFYYAGHGVQVGGENYLVPIDANPTRAADVDFQLVDVKLVLDQMQGAGTRLNIVILDACRNNPFGGRGLRSLSGGLAQMQAPDGTLISYATQPGSVALDGSGGHSPYTRALAAIMPHPGLDIFQTFNQVGLAVKHATDGSQQPWVSSSPIDGNFYFKPSPAGAAASSGHGSGNVEVTFWDSIKDSKNPQLYDAYLKRYPNGAFAAIAKIRVKQLKVADARPMETEPKQKALIRDPDLLTEVYNRLYELNFDPDSATAKGMKVAIREFEAQSSLPQDGEVTRGLLNRLREIGGLKPWGAIVYDKGVGKWGMSWDQPSRKAAVKSARAQCSPAHCASTLSFFGTSCGAFAISSAGWSIVSRDDIRQAQKSALDQCDTHGSACHIVGATCADGADRKISSN